MYFIQKDIPHNDNKVVIYLSSIDEAIRSTKPTSAVTIIVVLRLLYKIIISVTKLNFLAILGIYILVAFEEAFPLLKL